MTAPKATAPPKAGSKVGPAKPYTLYASLYTGDGTQAQTYQRQLPAAIAEAVFHALTTDAVADEIKHAADLLQGVLDGREVKA